MAFASHLSDLAICTRARPQCRTRPGRCRRTRPPSSTSLGHVYRSRHRSRPGPSIGRPRQLVVSLPLVGQPHVRAAGQVADALMIERYVDSDDRLLLGGLAYDHVLQPHSWVRTRGRVCVWGGGFQLSEMKKRGNIDTLKDRDHVSQCHLLPWSCVARSDRGRMPTAVIDWRQKSNRATRWRNRFADRAFEPAFDGYGAISRRIG